MSLPGSSTAEVARHSRWIRISCTAGSASSAKGGATPFRDSESGAGRYRTAKLERRIGLASRARLRFAGSFILKPFRDGAQ